VEQWAEIRRLYFVRRLSIMEIVRRTGHGRNTIRRALRSAEPPRHRRPPRPSKLDPFRDEIHRLLRSDPRLPGKRVRELLEEQGYVGGKTIVDDYLREVRPLFLPRPRTFQRTSYRPGALCQFDLWEPSSEIPVGAGQTRRGYVIVGPQITGNLKAGARGRLPTAMRCTRRAPRPAVVTRQTRSPSRPATSKSVTSWKPRTSGRPRR
jgi:hypothetical protein